jgi:hypothetical protein
MLQKKQVGGAVDGESLDDIDPLHDPIPPGAAVREDTGPQSPLVWEAVTPAIPLLVGVFCAGSACSVYLSLALVMVAPYAALVRYMAWRGHLEVNLTPS